MRVLIDDTLVTAPLTMPLRQGWLEAEALSLRLRLGAADVAPDDAALLSSGESTELAESHAIVPEVAIVCDGVGAIAMRTPVRPDGIEETPIRLYGVSRTAELLMRATLRPFFGITAAGFIDNADVDGAAAEVVVVEGEDALRTPEVGFQEDLCRAWFILTGLRFVSHVFVVPTGTPNDAVRVAIGSLQRLVGAGVERRREVRVALATDDDLDRDRLVEVTNRLRYRMEPPDVDSLHMLLARGSWGTTYPRTLPSLREPAPDS